MTPTEQDYHTRGYRRLAAAVLVQAIQDVHGGHSARRQGATEWFLAGEKGALSFKSCCEILGRDAEDVRSRLMNNVGVPRRFLDCFRTSDEPYPSRVGSRRM
jgi:hypothetical protein